jgi:hypothetical protein
MLPSFIRPIASRFNFTRDLTGKELAHINRYLGELGLPAYCKSDYIDGLWFNPIYTLSPTPRFVVTWGGVKLVQVYLQLKVGPDDYGYDQICSTLNLHIPPSAGLFSCEEPIEKEIVIDF